MFYVEDKDFISKDQGRYLDEVVTKATYFPDFPWYLSPHQVVDDDKPYLFHSILNRSEDKKDGLAGFGPVDVNAPDESFNSAMGPFFMKLFNQFSKRNNIKYELIYRCCINLSFSLSSSPTPHTDHPFTYKHFLIYLNDSDGDTCIFNEKETEIEKRITPEKYKGVCFEKRLHYAEFPTNGLRFVVAFTFI